MHGSTTDIAHRFRRLTRQLGFAALAVGGVALGVGWWLDARHALQRRCAATARLMADATQGISGGGAWASDGFQALAWSALQDPAVLAVAVVSPVGDVLAFCPADRDSEQIARIARRGSGRLPTGRAAPRVVTGRAQLQGGQDAIVVVARADAAAKGAAGTLVAAAGFAACVALMVHVPRRFVWRQALHPLRGLTACVAAPGVSQLPASLTQRRDEIGGLARTIEPILEQRRDYSARIGQLERTVDARVREQTRRIEALLARAERRAWIDPLTRLGNRRLLEDRLEQLFNEQRDRNEDLSLVVFDVDNFKGLNDTLGHGAGDEMLRFVGELLNGSLRSSDLGLRYAGDEFVALLLDTSAEDAAVMVDRIIKLFNQRASLYQLEQPVTLSAGVASLKRHGAASGEELLNLADSALYQSKHAGKGRVCVFGPGTVART